MKLSRVVLLALPLAAAACAAPTDPSEDIGTVAEPIVGPSQNGGLAGILLITSSANATVRTGTLIDATTVLVASSAFPANQNPRQLTLTYGAGSGNVTTVSASDIVRHPTLDIALIKLASPIAGSRSMPIDTRAPSALRGTTLRCYGFTAQSALVHVDLTVQATTSTSLSLQAPAWAAGQMIDNGDAGVPCFDIATWTLVSVSRSTSGITNTQTSVSSIPAWLPGAQNLFGVRAQPLVRAFSLYFLRNQADASSRNCLDIPNGSTATHAPVNQYPCHYGPAQQFYFDYRTNPNYPAMVSASSGLCVDIPNGSTASGTGLQQYPCHGGANQAWETRLFNPQGAGFGYGSRVSPAANLCLSGVGTNPSVNVQTATCQSGTTTNTQQRWFIRWI